MAHSVVVDSHSSRRLDSMTDTRPRSTRLILICLCIAQVALQAAGCSSDAPPVTPSPACSDGIDNDGDGFIDFSMDPGCEDRSDLDETDPTARCADGQDNDSDGLIDFPADPGCEAAGDTTEDDDCPDGWNCAACGNGQDDDGDGLVDYPTDPACTSAADNDENPRNGEHCELTTDLVLNTVIGGRISHKDLSQIYSPTCGGGGPEKVYRLQIDEPTHIVVTSIASQNEANTILYLRTDCQDSATELLCDDRENEHTASIAADLQPGTYTVVVDTSGVTLNIAYSLEVRAFPTIGARCDPETTQCPPETTCRPADDVATETTCEYPACRDGRDNEFDGTIDFPHDAGCASADDTNESDDCPDAHHCPECANDVDDDGDGQIDFPADPGCISAADGGESDVCPLERDPIGTIVSRETKGTTYDHSNDTMMCSAAGFTADKMYVLNVENPLNSLNVAPVGPSCPAVSIQTSTCDDAVLECAPALLEDVAPGQYLITLDTTYDAYCESSGQFNLYVHGILPGGGPCDEGRAASGLFTCEDGFFCQAGMCVESACKNGVDDDGDGLVDTGEDPGCEHDDDIDESDDCPSGPRCPVCANSIDDNGDGFIDYPSDPRCAAPGDMGEWTCTGERDPLRLLAARTTTGHLAGLHNDVTPSCHSVNHTAPEQQFLLEVDAPLVSLDVDTKSPYPLSQWRQVLSLREAACDAQELACVHPDGVAYSSLHRDDVEPGAYIIAVDGWRDQASPYTLNVHGVIESGGACDSARIESGLFSCEYGSHCDGSTCVVSACGNGIDDDNDGFIDAPTDPGCTDISDPDEADACAAGVNCAACSNGIDDDGDGRIDYPREPGCISAGDDDELDCAGETDAIQPIVARETQGTTIGHVNDWSPACDVYKYHPDAMHSLYVPTELTTLDINARFSDIDARLVIRRSACTNPDLACNTDEATGAPIALTNVSAGWYFLIVDGKHGTGGPYNLDVHGVIPAGQPCEPVHEATGLFTCETGHICRAGVCSPSACGNGMDDDGDGFTDIAEDPGCADMRDDDEFDDCPSGPDCAACANGSDDDNDVSTDHPNDPGCAYPGDATEYDCQGQSQIELLTERHTRGFIPLDEPSTVEQSCSSFQAGDRVYALSLEVPLTSLSVYADSGHISLKSGTCTQPDLACDSDGIEDSFSSIVQLNSVAPGLYYVIMNDYGEYNLSIYGTIQSGERCDVPLVDAGAFRCEDGTSCTDGVCSPPSA